ncbi:uncharacterized protein SCDLUD_003697 [Saccharomycodes ludwigii]|uniref:uncharacterized protein n=1 Tax=Saccharomycodes ludwigii TaxID=36035 RepID=UPI001E83B9E4|nr:hypothetical protein SCDLUD_003697 [Saccharomycodes ludwigii]KAH3900697.1 hypothetical protein SCDLUD_003697 [Saccharomycodes ludwigii]
MSSDSSSIIVNLYTPTNKILDKTHSRTFIYKYFRGVTWLYYIHLPCALLSNVDSILVYNIFNLVIFFCVYAVYKYFSKLII